MRPLHKVNEYMGSRPSVCMFHLLKYWIDSSYI
jgi:hypothetical protein